MIIEGLKIIPVATLREVMDYINQNKEPEERKRKLDFQKINSKKYNLVEEKRPGKYFPVYEDERGTFLFNTEDLCMIEYIPELIKCGITSLRIDGKMKDDEYVATAVKAYRKAIDDYFESPKLYRENMEWYKEQIMGCTYRLFTTGFFYGKPDETSQIYDSNTYAKDYTYLGFLEEKTEKGLYRITQRNKFLVGETIEVMRPDGENRLVTVKAIYDEEGNSCDSAPHPQQVLYLDLGEDLNVFDLLRRKESVS